MLHSPLLILGWGSLGDSNYEYFGPRDGFAAFAC